MENNDIKQQLNSIKDNVLNKVLVIVLFVMIFGLTISVLRIPQTGFKPIFAAHASLFVIVLFLFLFRNKIPVTIKGGIFMGVMYAMAFSGLLSWGLYGFGYVYIIPAVAMAFAYFNRKTGWIITLTSLFAVISIAVLFNKNILDYTPDDVHYMQSFPMWMNMIITLSLISVVITLFWENLLGMLIKTFSKINEQQNKLQHFNEELISAKEKAEESDRLKSSFLQSMSHEIRTPLNIIIGFTDMITQTDDEEERKELNEVIKANSNQMLKMVNDIVDFSKIESNSIQFYNKTFNIKDLISDLENKFKNHVPDNVELSLQKIDLELTTDRERLYQILYNLIDNALKFTTQGHIKLNCFQTNNHLTITVEDSGIGIHEEHLVKIFDRFYKVDSFAQGAGLGLCLSKSMANIMGGDIKVESVINKGSTFEFYFPLN
jgi:signal transduction histidine kinase